MTAISPAKLPFHGRTIETAACLIIGDEVLNGKTRDSNSHFFARYCFEIGVELKRIETIPDKEETISEAVQRLSRNFDLVVTSGGIGSTHDDITYPSIAKAFGLPLVKHQPTWERMCKLAAQKPGQSKFDWETPSDSLTAKWRMVTMPIDEKRDWTEQIVYADEGLWVPICIVNHNVVILPGIPYLFERLLRGFQKSIVMHLSSAASRPAHRIVITTPLPESSIARFLTDFADRVAADGVKVGSYPKWGESRNLVTLIGRDLELLQRLAPEVKKAVEGEQVSDSDAMDNEDERERERERPKRDPTKLGLIGRNSSNM